MGDVKIYHDSNMFRVVLMTPTDWQRYMAEIWNNPDTPRNDVQCCAVVKGRRCRNDAPGYYNDLCGTHSKHMACGAKIELMTFEEATTKPHPVPKWKENNDGK